MFDISAHRAGRRRRAASGASRPLLAAGVLSGLLLIASIGPSVARAGAVAAPVRPHGFTATPSAPSGAPGGATMEAATPLANAPRYRGTVEPGQELWYRFKDTGAGEGRVYIELWGRTQSCPVRATLFDASGRALGELVSFTREIEPFIVYFPPQQVSLTYYLRIDAESSSASCAGADYVFRLLEPEQPSCSSTAGPNGEERKACVLAAKSVPAYVANACSAASQRYLRIVRALSRRISARTRRRLNREKAAAKRELARNCHH